MYSIYSSHPTLAVAVLYIGGADVTFFLHIFLFPLRDLLEEQSANWVAGGIQITCNPQKGRCSKWPLESEITRVIFAQFKLFYRATPVIVDQRSTLSPAADCWHFF